MKFLFFLVIIQIINAPSKNDAELRNTNLLKQISLLRQYTSPLGNANFDKALKYLEDIILSIIRKESCIKKELDVLHRLPIDIIRNIAVFLLDEIKFLYFDDLMSHNYYCIDSFLLEPKNYFRFTLTPIDSFKFNDISNLFIVLYPKRFINDLGCVLSDIITFDQDLLKLLKKAGGFSRLQEYLSYIYRGDKTDINSEQKFADGIMTYALHLIQSFFPLFYLKGDAKSLLFAFDESVEKDQEIIKRAISQLGMRFPLSYKTICEYSLIKYFVGHKYCKSYNSYATPIELLVDNTSEKIDDILKIILNINNELFCGLTILIGSCNVLEQVCSVLYASPNLLYAYRYSENVPKKLLMRLGLLELFSSDVSLQDFIEYIAIFGDYGCNAPAILQLFWKNEELLTRHQLVLKNDELFCEVESLLIKMEKVRCQIEQEFLEGNKICALYNEYMIQHMQFCIKILDFLKDMMHNMSCYENVESFCQNMRALSLKYEQDGFFISNLEDLFKPLNTKLSITQRLQNIYQYFICAIKKCIQWIKNFLCFFCHNIIALIA